MKLRSLVESVYCQGLTFAVCMWVTVCLVFSHCLTANCFMYFVLVLMF